MKDRIRGLYKRGNTFWFTHQNAGRRFFVSLKTDDEQGKSLYRYDFDRPYYRHIEPMGYRWVTPHIMRHTFGSLLASRGCSIYKIAIWMGDEVSTTQKHYAKLLPIDPDIELASTGHA